MGRVPSVALLVVFVLRTFVFTIIRVDGHSMDTTLANNERLFVTVFDVKISGADRGDNTLGVFGDGPDVPKQESTAWARGYSFFQSELAVDFRNGPALGF